MPPLPLPLKIIFLVVVTCLIAPLSWAKENLPLQLLQAKITTLAEGAQFVASFNAKPDYRLMLLDDPPRLVIDLPQASLAASLEATKIDLKGEAGLVRQLSYGLNGAGGVRLIIEANAPFKIEDWRLIPLHETVWQLVMDFAPTSAPDFAEQTAWLNQNFSQQNIAAGNAKADTPPTSRKALSRPFTVVIDAGHGGFDSGAEGISGLLEKDVTLAFAHTLREIILQQNPSFTVALTREDDNFLRLSERVAIAHKIHADLFISIHADSIHLPNVRGATVYTISDKASDALAKAIAENENRADLLDDLPEDEPQDVTDILLDLTRRETDALSMRFADGLVDALSHAGVRLIKPPHRYAGFMVLRAPEIPSVLVELGYLSNAQDEKLIADPHWRTHIASTMAKAIAEYALNRGGGG